MARAPHIVLVNGVYPPDGGASGRVANDLVRHLMNSGIQVSVITTAREYKKSDESNQPYGMVSRIPSRQWKKPILLRLIAAFWDSYWLIIKARKLDPDYYITCTDPPFLHFLSTFLLKSKKWLLWTMDLYPEAFVAHGLVMENNWIVKTYRRALTRVKPQGIITLGARQAAFVKSQYDIDPALNVILPCGVAEMQRKSMVLPKWKNDTRKIYFGYTGNLGEAHSGKFLENLVKYSDPNKHHFIFSVFGAKALQLKNNLKDRQNVFFVNWIPSKEMVYFDIQIVTLDHKWTHVCVPSKAVSAICMGVPLVYHGASEGDIPNSYRKAIWHIQDVRRAIQQFYALLSTEQLCEKKQSALNYASDICVAQKEGYSQIVNFLLNE